MREPNRLNDVDLLEPAFAHDVREILGEMRRLGWDPVVIETKRLQQRQNWLWQIGRRGRKGERPVTWVRYSMHQKGIAADIISASRGYDSPEFFATLAQVASVHGCTTLVHDACHVELNLEVMRNGKNKGDQ